MLGTALVTGASSGLGLALSERLAREGYRVALVARRAEVLESVADGIARRGGAAVACPADVSSRLAVREAVARCEEELGPVDLLVANAGISRMTPAQSLSASEVEVLLRVNFLGSVYAAETVLPPMLARGSGHLVVMGSLAGYGGLPKSAAYSASKGALHNFFESLRLDLRGTGVHVTVITPGYVRTPLTDQNDHPMPLLMEVDEAVDRMWGAIRDRRRLHAFPRPLSTLAWGAQVLPAGVYDWLASKLRRDKKAGAGPAPPSPELDL